MWLTFLTDFSWHNYWLASRSEQDGRSFSNSWRAVSLLIVVALTIESGNVLSVNGVDPDLWGHVQVGRDLLNSWELPKTTTYTFTAHQHVWINHEYLAQIVFAIVFQSFGSQGLLIIKCLIGLVVLAIMMRLAVTNDVNPIIAAAYLVLVANTLAYYFFLRPQLFTYLFFVILLYVLDRAFRCTNQNGKCLVKLSFAWLSTLPLIFLTWANIHGGFAAGACVLVVYMIGRGVQATNLHGKLEWRTIALLVMTTAACLSATLINPYGASLYSGLIASISHPRPEIAEWGSLKIVHGVFASFTILLTASVISLVLSRRRHDWLQLLILLCVTWHAISHIRHIAILALLLGCWMPCHVQSALGRFKPSIACGMLRRFDTRFSQFTLVFVAAILIATGTVALSDRLSRLRVSGSRYPIDALNYMAQNRIDGKAVVSYEWALYAVAALAPKLQVAFDSRCEQCYPQEILDMQFGFHVGDSNPRRHQSDRSDHINCETALRYGAPDLVLINRGYRASEFTMQLNSAEWVLLYQDALAQLWGRRCHYDNPDNAKFVAPARRIISDFRPISVAEWPALPSYTLGDEHRHNRVRHAPNRLRYD